MIPQILFIFLQAAVVLAAFHQHHKPRTGYYDRTIDIAFVVLEFVLLGWGGFFNGLFN